jgi:glycosyltransferase involved in cell wall biosynthesis
MKDLERLSFIFVATAWGPLKGGINALNMDLCLAVAAKGHRVACIVEKENDDTIADAEMKQVVLIQHNDPRAESEAEQLVQRVRQEGIITNSWWIGHDSITGNTALRAAKLAGGRAAVFHHMHHLAFKLIEGESSQKVQSRDNTQREIFQAAHLVVAVGPKLLQSANDLIRGAKTSPKIIELTPGLANITPADSPSNFSIAIFGRFEESAAKTKQLDLSVAAFGQASQDENGPLGRHPNLTVYGSSDKGSRKRLDLILERYAKRRLNLHILDFETDREKLFSAMAKNTVVMMLSWYEAFGLVAWEAIAAGVPLVISRATGAYQKLCELLGPETDNFVYAVDIKAASDVAVVRDEDVKAVVTALNQIASDVQGARRRSLVLRERLIQAEISWEAASEKLITGCLAIDNFSASPTRHQESPEQVFICSEIGIGTRDFAVALCLVVDSLDETKTQIGALASTISRARSIPPEMATRIAKHGFNPSIDSPDVFLQFRNFILTAPVRAYAVVTPNTASIAPEELRRRMFSGLLKSRIEKRNININTVLTDQSSVSLLLSAVKRHWRKYRGNVPLPLVTAEAPSKNALQGIANLMAMALADAANATNCTNFNYLRIKFAHIFDTASRKNYLSDAQYP